MPIMSWVLRHAGQTRNLSSELRDPTMNCIPIESVPSIVDSVLTEAGASKAVRARAIGIVNEIRAVYGPVILVQTDATNRMICVASPGGPGACFKFPPNSPANEAELIRAQDTSRSASVTYKTDAQGVNLIESVLIYAGAAAGSSAVARY